MFHDAPIEAAVTIHRKPRVAVSAQQQQHQQPSIADLYDLSRIVDYLLDRETPIVRAALQFPDDLLPDSIEVIRTLEEMLRADPRHATSFQSALEEPKEKTRSEVCSVGSACCSSSKGVTTCTTAGCTSSPSGAVLSAALRKNASVRAADAAAHANPHAPTTTRFYVLADTTFDSCCPDEITAQHYQSQCIIHFGEACMSRSARLPVLYIHTPFFFKAISSSSAFASHQEKSTPLCRQVSPTSVRLVVDVVRRLASELGTMQHDWLDEHPHAAVSVRLVVVGTHALEALMHQAQDDAWRQSKLGLSEENHKSNDTAVEVDWCSFARRDGGNREGCCGVSSVAAPAPGTETCSSPREDASMWAINGVQVPRLGAATSTDAEESGARKSEVQYFLFVGPSTAAHLTHVQLILQYNAFHYTDFAREFVDEATMRDGPAMVSVLDENIGDDESVKECKEATKLSWDSSEDDVHAFVSRVLASRSHTERGSGLSALTCSPKAALALQRRLRQRDFNIETIRASSAIGILVASLSVESYYEITMLLHKFLRARGKRSYVIYIGHLNEFKLANFVDTVDCFVAIACPNSRSSHFPEKGDGFLKPVVSPAEVLLALEAEDASSPMYGDPALYTTVFECVIPSLRAALADQMEGDGTASGKVQVTEKDWGASTALVRTGGAGGGALTTVGAQGSLARMHERFYVGLETCVGQTPVQTEVAEGKHGIARGYAAERTQHQSPKSEGSA